MTTCLLVHPQDRLFDSGALVGAWDTSVSMTRNPAGVAVANLLSRVSAGVFLCRQVSRSVDG